MRLNLLGPFVAAAAATAITVAFKNSEKANNTIKNFTFATPTLLATVVYSSLSQLTSLGSYSRPFRFSVGWITGAVFIYLANRREILAVCRAVYASPRLTSNETANAHNQVQKEQAHQILKGMRCLIAVGATIVACAAPLFHISHKVLHKLSIDLA